MPLDWLDMTDVPFSAVALLERVQLSWLPGWLPERELAIALAANPVVAWTMATKCPEIAPWLDRVMAQVGPASPTELRAAEETVLYSLTDLIVYVLDPAAYDAQPFLGWDSRELADLTDWPGRRVLDIGSGTGRLGLTVAEIGARVYCVEPVANLRHYMRGKAAARGLDQVFVVDGLITAIPFEDRFADVTMGGHVFGDDPAAELAELERVTRPGGTVILCPGNGDHDDARHQFLLAAGYDWSRFEEPRDGWKRKYWRTLPSG